VRILYLADIRFPLDRANGIQTMETCCALAERGHDVHLLVRPDTATPSRDPFVFYGVPPQARLHVERVPVSGAESRRRLTYIGWALGRTFGLGGRADVVLTRDLTVAGLIARTPRASRPPFVYESHGLAPVFARTRPEMISGGTVPSGAKLRRLASREARVWRRADGYIAITSGLAHDLTEEFGPRRNVATVADGARLPAERRFIPPRPTTTPIVVYAGHLYPWKGVDLLLQALVRLPQATAVIAGGHPAESDLARLQTLASTLGVANRVTFLGFIDRAEVASLLARADVLVLPHTATPVSDRYASPLKLFEYMATGKPIVASDLAAVREVLHDGENASLVTPGDAQALADGIAGISADQARAERLARRAFDDAASYSWLRRAERIEPVLREAIGS
jgi:glycosyltransferase involved in cell wall biosynthesis